MHIARCTVNRQNECCKCGPKLKSKGYILFLHESLSPTKGEMLDCGVKPAFLISPFFCHFRTLLRFSVCQSLFLLWPFGSSLTAFESWAGVYVRGLYRRAAVLRYVYTYCSIHLLPQACTSFCRCCPRAF